MARKDLFINFMVVALLAQGGKLVLVTVNLGKKKDTGNLLAPLVGQPC